MKTINISYLTVTYILLLVCISFISNIYVPDSEIMFDELISLLNRDISATNYVAEREDARLIYYLYKPFYVLFRSPLSFIIPNLIMLFISIYFAYKLFYKFSKNSAFLSSLAIAINPYLLISITGISKEIPLCAVTCILFYIVKNKSVIRLIFASQMCLISFGIRPVYGAILCFSFLPLMFLSEKIIEKFKLRILFLFIPFILTIFFGMLAENIPIINRMLLIQKGLDAGTEIGRENLEKSISSLETGGIAPCINLIYRTFANLFSILFRPTLTTENGNLSLLGAGYWIYGFLVSVSFIGMIFILISLVSKNKRTFFPKITIAHEEYYIHLIFSVIYIIMATSLSLIIQPRYLMPILSIKMGILGILPPKQIYRISFFVLLLSFFGYIFLTFMLGIEPNKSIDSIYKPDFVL
jgi:hypothetical protein